MSRNPDLESRRAIEQSRIRALMTAQRAGERAKLKIGPEHVAWVKEEMCIGCDQCTIVCDDNAIEVYPVKLRSPILDVDVNKKAGSYGNRALVADCVFLVVRQTRLS